jgi:hypothetical protein
LPLAAAEHVDFRFNTWFRRATLKSTSHGPLRVTCRQSGPSLGCSVVGEERPAHVAQHLAPQMARCIRQASPEPSRSHYLLFPLAQVGIWTIIVICLPGTGSGVAGAL